MRTDRKKNVEYPTRKKKDEYKEKLRPSSGSENVFPLFCAFAGSFQQSLRDAEPQQPTLKPNESPGTVLKVNGRKLAKKKKT